jgi:hypothetical protein
VFNVAANFLVFITSHERKSYSISVSCLFCELLLIFSEDIFSVVTIEQICVLFVGDDVKRRRRLVIQ